MKTDIEKLQKQLECEVKKLVVKANYNPLWVNKFREMRRQ